MTEGVQIPAAMLGQRPHLPRLSLFTCKREKTATLSINPEEQRRP